MLCPPWSKGVIDMEEQYRRVALKDLENNPWQPREVFPREKLEGLADSVRELGVIQPVVARLHPKKKGTYQLAVGAMRSEASRLAGLKDIPAMIRDLSDRQMRLYGLSENLHRAELTDVEKEKAIHGLWKKVYEPEGKKPQDLAKDLGISLRSAKEILDAYDVRESLNVGEKASTSNLSRVASLAVADRKTARELLKAREREDLSDRDFRRVVPFIRETPKEMRGATVSEVMKAHQQAKSYVSSVHEEMEVRKGKPRVEVRKVSSSDERAVARLADIFKDLKFYATMSFVGTIRDAKTREKAIKLVGDMETQLSRELQRIQKRGW